MPAEKKDYGGQLPRLLIPREEAVDEIKSRWQKGEDLQSARIQDFNSLERFKDTVEEWSDYNRDLLLKIFDDSSIAEDYEAVDLPSFWDGGLLSEAIKFQRQYLMKKNSRLLSVLKRLKLFPEVTESQEFSQERSFGEKVFLVHGHDEGAKEKVARLIEKLDLVCVILHEQDNEGRTIIEKFMDHAKDPEIGFAVVLMTPDDAGGELKEEGVELVNLPGLRYPNLKPRARQNVIFELGFFLGYLGRGRVCALMKEHEKRGEIDAPTDYKGVLYIPLDEKGAWRIDLAKEMKSAGLPVDMNKIL